MFEILTLYFIGVRIGSIIQNVVGMGVGIAIAFSASWRLSLLTLACIPFVAAAGQWTTENFVIVGRHWLYHHGPQYR